MKLNKEQKKKLSSFFINISQAMILAGLLAPIALSSFEQIKTINAFLGGMLFLYIGLSLLK